MCYLLYLPLNLRPFDAKAIKLTIGPSPLLLLYLNMGQTGLFLSLFLSFGEVGKDADQ